MPDNKITNSASILSYNYKVDPTKDPKNIDVEINASKELDFVEPNILFTKVCSPHYIDLTDEFTITYTVENATLEADYPILSKIEITDSIFELDNLTLMSSDGLTLLESENLKDTGIITVELDPGLAPGNIKTITLTFKVENGFDLSNPIGTEATCKFYIKLENVDEEFIDPQTDDCALEINNGTLTMVKESSVIDKVSPGYIIPYTITIQNTGNAPSIIPMDEFVDTFPINTRLVADSLSVTSIPDGNIITGIVPNNTDIKLATSLHNTSDLTIEGGDGISIEFELVVTN